VLVRSRSLSSPGSFKNAEALKGCYNWECLWSRFCRGNLLSGRILRVVRNMPGKERSNRTRTRMSRYRRGGYRLRNRRHGLNLNPHILGYVEVVVIPTQMAEEGRVERQLGFKRTTHGIDYTVHLIHAVGTWHFEGENLWAGHEIPKRGTRVTF